MRKCLISIVILLLALPAVALSKTKLTKKAEELKSGMTREQVIEVLGPATWAVLPDDDGPASIADFDGVSLQLQWNNGSDCTPVTLLFDNGMKVMGIDDGSICFDEGIDATWLPPNDYSCSKGDRSGLCN